MNWQKTLTKVSTIFVTGIFLCPAVCAAGDREGWRHFKDEGSKFEVFGDFAGAERAYAKSLKLVDASKASTAERGEVMARLANVMLWQQKFKQAEPYYNELLKLIPQLKSEGKKNEDFFTCVDSLSNAYYERSQGVNRIPGIQHSVRIIDTAFGDIHPELPRELVALAYTYSALGMNQEALTFANRALSIAKRETSEKGQIQLWKTLALVGNCRKSVGDWEGARQAFEQAVFLMNKSLKRFSLTAAAAKAQLAIVYLHMQKKEESKKLFKEAEALFASKLYEMDKKGLRDIGTAGPELLALAQMYVAFSQYSKAEPICRRSLMLTKVTFGDKDPFLINELRVHGFVLSRLGRMKESQGQEAQAQALASLYK